jgi:hypothetical protein
MIRELGVEGFTKYQTAMFHEGSKTHELIEHYFLDKEKFDKGLVLLDSIE